MLTLNNLYTNNYFSFFSGTFPHMVNIFLINGYFLTQYLTSLSLLAIKIQYSKFIIYYIRLPYRTLTPKVLKSVKAAPFFRRSKVSENNLNNFIK